MNLLNQKYYFQAIDNYPYNMELAMEALGYALSYDDEDADTLLLLARAYSEELIDYENARSYFLAALAINPTSINIAPYYVRFLLKFEEWETAENYINFALSLKGLCKRDLYWFQSNLFELKKDYKSAIKSMQSVALFAFNKNDMVQIDERIAFLKDKKVRYKKLQKSEKKPLLT